VVTEPPVSDPPPDASTLGYRSIKLQNVSTAPILPFDGMDLRAAEQYRIIRTKICQHARRPQVCLISSPTSGDGKTVTAINVAGALALKNDASVLLMDCDFRRPSVAKTLNIPNEPGLSDVLEGNCLLRDAIVQIEQVSSFYVLPAGKATRNPTELLDSGLWKSTCVALKKNFQYIVMDSAPLGTVADFELLQVMADGVILVVRPDRSNRSLSFKSFEAVPKQQLLGIVLNCAQEWFLFSSSNPYNHYYY
jgi:capsular exopolysaccharide synthesis family protein